MARIRNKRIYSDNPQLLKDLQEEYREYGGWDTEINGDTLTIFALNRKLKSRKEKKRDKKSRHRTKAHKHNNE
jgi:hypothetical protein